MSKSFKTYLAEHLKLSPQVIDQAEQRAAATNVSFMHALEQLEVAPEAQILEAFAKLLRVQFANIGNMDIPHNIIQLMPKDLAQKHRVIPIDRAGNHIILAMGDPRNLKALDEIRFRTGYTPKAVLASEMRIGEALEKYYLRQLDTSALSAANLPTNNAAAKKSQERQKISFEGDNSAGDGPIIKLVNDIVLQCLKRRASDIHFEPYEHFMRVRLRVDGVLHEIARPPANVKASLTSRVKIMAKMNIAENRLPQDGAVNIHVDNRDIDFRVNCLPTVYGEKIVMRILDKRTLNVDMTKLGFEADDLKKFTHAIHQPYGMVLVTGPTGSGKTTTLYSAIAELNKESDNIMTAEDPVEFNIEGVNQVHMKPDIGLDFAAALRAFLRQDPDIILVGEIRDLETAEIAIKAALTGHLVLSTLHTNSAPQTAARLLNMGVEPFNLVASLNCIVAQRLVRTICSRCKIVDESITPEILAQLGMQPAEAAKTKAYKGKGCPACGSTGMMGRIAVHEVMYVSENIKEAILKGYPVTQLKAIAIQDGMRSLRQSALLKLAAGLTTVLEVTKTTAADGDAFSEGAARKLSVAS